MTTVNSQVKYKRALDWCDANKDKLPRGAKYRLMTTGNLYKLLFSFGVAWNKQAQLWGNQDMENGADVVNVLTPRHAEKGASARTLIRIIAHRALIGRRVSELVELCEALNWSVVKISDPLGEADTEFWRVYITVMTTENGD